MSIKALKNVLKIANFKPLLFCLFISNKASGIPKAEDVKVGELIGQGIYIGIGLN